MNPNYFCCLSISFPSLCRMIPEYRFFSKLSSENIINYPNMNLLLCSKDYPFLRQSIFKLNPKKLFDTKNPDTYAD